MQQKEEDKGQCDLFEVIPGINHKEFKEDLWSCIRPSANPSIFKSVKPLTGEDGNAIDQNSTQPSSAP